MASRVKGIQNVNKNMHKFVADVQHKKTPKALLLIAQTGRGIAMLHTPVDLGNLINGVSYEMIGPTTAAVIYKNGFSDTGFNYGLYLHENTNWSPVSKKNAKHHFLSDAFENQSYQGEYRQIIKEQYQL